MSNLILVGTNSIRYQQWRSKQNAGKNNGAYFYAKEIEDIILPEVQHLNLLIITVGAFYKSYEVPEGAVIICHDNINTIKTYRKLFRLKALWICSKKSVAEELKLHGENAAYIPLSIDTEYVKQFKRKKTKDTAYVGNAWRFKQKYLRSLPSEIDQINGLERDDLLKEMAKYKNVIAEGRCLIEAKILGANVSRPSYDGINIIDREVIDTREVLPQWVDVLTSHAKTPPRRFLIATRRFLDLNTGFIRPHKKAFSVNPKRAKELLDSKHRVVEEYSFTALR